MFGTANQEPGTTASNDQRLRRCVRRVAQDGLGDLEEAFFRGQRVKWLLFVEQPKGGIPDLQQGQLLRLEAVVYGTLRGSVHWRGSRVIVNWILNNCLHDCVITLGRIT